MDPDADPADSEIIVQWGAQGQPGANLIAETILQRIEECGVYIADLTCVTSVRTADKRKKLLPNANVLIETGAAARTGRRWDRMILVLNNAFGSVDKLPFDLRHRSCTVQYDLKENDDREKTSKRRQLAKDIANEIRPMYQASLLRDSEERRKAAEAKGAHSGGKRQPAQHAREEYEDKLLANKYRTFKAKAGILAVTVFPAVSQVFNVPPHHNQFNGQLSPVSISYGVVEHEMKSEVCIWPDGQPPVGITELTHEGTIYSTKNMVFNYTDEELEDITKRINFVLTEYENYIIEALHRYFACLKELKVTGPFFIGVSLLRIRKFRLMVRDSPVHSSTIRRATRKIFKPIFWRFRPMQTHLKLMSSQR